MKLRIALCFVALFLMGACVPSLEDEDIPRRFDTDTVMGVIQERGVLRVGIDPERPPFSFVDGDEAKGFVVDLAHELAGALGVKVEFATSPSNGMLIPLDAGSVDVIFPLGAVTERLAKKYGVTDPYYIAHERLLTNKKTSIDNIDSACTLVDQETEAPLEDVVDGAREVVGRDAAWCASALSLGGVDAVLGADPLLMNVWTLAAECSAPCGGEYRIQGDQYSTEGYSAVIAPGNSGWQSYINNVFDETKAEGRWVRFHDEWLRPYLLHKAEPPDMTAEEAAALYPRDLE